MLLYVDRRKAVELILKISFSEKTLALHMRMLVLDGSRDPLFSIPPIPDPKTDLVGVQRVDHAGKK